MQTLWFLFAVYTIIWAALFGYVMFLVTKQRQLRRELDSLKETVQKKSQES